MQQATRSISLAGMTLMAALECPHAPSGPVHSDSFTVASAAVDPHAAGSGDDEIDWP